MLAVVSTYSTGAISPGDKIGDTDVTLILRSSTIAGEILKPSRPATAIDACFEGAAFFDSKKPN